VKSLGVWLLVFVCALVFTFLVDLGGNFFGIPDAALHVLFAANLTLFLWLLARFVGRPIVGFLDTRSTEISQELEEARRKVAEAESLRQQVQQRLDQIGAEVSAMTERAERDGEVEAKEIAEQTTTDQERFLRRVEDEIDRRTAEARQTLSLETSELTAQLTKALLERELTDDDRQRILDRSLQAMRSGMDKE
jgi:ATP synthase F0 subunit b